MKPRVILTIAIVAMIALLLALAPWPYGYYQLLRIVVCGIAVICAFHFGDQSEAGRVIVIAMVATAAIYNPFLPVHLNRELWSILNVGGAILFAFVAWKANARAKSRDSQV